MSYDPNTATVHRLPTGEPSFYGRHVNHDLHGITARANGPTSYELRERRDEALAADTIASAFLANEGDWSELRHVVLLPLRCANRTVGLTPEAAGIVAQGLGCSPASVTLTAAAALIIRDRVGADAAFRFLDYAFRASTDDPMWHMDYDDALAAGSTMPTDPR